MKGQEVKAILGKNIKFFRYRREYSQADLAEKAEISITFLSNIERGLKYPKPDILSKIADRLEVKIYELFKADIVPDDNKELMNRLFEDMSQKVNQAMKGVLKQYLRNTQYE
jgi:transcriptional regulator with XRE-family HTH domain